jgi:hypothetical protein
MGKKERKAIFDKPAVVRIHPKGMESFKIRFPNNKLKGQ